MRPSPLNPPPVVIVPAYAPSEASRPGVAEAAKGYAARADVEARAFVRSKPLAAVGAGLAVGALVGWLVKR